MTYLLHPTSRAVILPNPQNPGQILATIHSAREMEWNGHKLVTVPFKVWEAQMLRARGVNVPSPIGYYYDWPRDRTLVPEPFFNQRETSAAFTLWNRGYCLSEMGVGKTLSAMWAADYLMRSEMIRKCLVLSPLSTIQRVWGDACFAHFRGRSIAIMHGTAAKRRKLLAQNHDFYVINHEALDIICEVKKKIIKDRETGLPIGEKIISAELMRDDIDLFIVDELGNYRNHQTSKWRTLKGIIKPKTWVWGLTGTPTPNEPSDAWAQCNLITPWTVPDYYSSFRQMTMQKLTEHIWVPLENAPEIVYRVMQPSIRFTRDQCFDLPPRTYSTREVELTPEQKKHYHEVSKELFTEVAGGKVTAVNEGVKAGKLLQIACGVVLDSEGTPRALNCKPRIDLIKELIEEAGHKVIVFVPFTAPLLMLAAALEKYHVAVVYGGVSHARRNTIFADFQSNRHPRVLLADAGCMSHGLTLTEANTVIWYGAEWSNDTYTQANDRITRAGQKNAQHVIHIVSSPIERRLYARLAERGRMQGTLLEMVRNGEAL